VQAGQRTSLLFRLANFHRAMVVGTGDLSELALGWCTYGVGDHMAHYAVNASVPKTLIQYLIRWVAEKHLLGSQASPILLRILDTEISPELVPDQDPHHHEPHQRTEDVIGPYEIQDFYLYYISRFGFTLRKIAFLAHHAWQDSHRGTWPNVPQLQRREYTLQELKRFLHIFCTRFFKTSQFKRSCIPNAPKVGSGGSLSPRGDYRAPSDSEAEVWLRQVSSIPDALPLVEYE
ncbi:MAG: NAD(+) synthase, partial [Myxococcota bacterium]